MEIVRYGIIGFGAHAEQCYAEMLLKNKEIECATISAIAEPFQKRIDTAKAILPKDIKFFNNYIDMLESGLIDAAIITSPHPYHPEMVIECLKRDIPVMCEKPAGIYAKQVKNMIKASENSSALFGMMFNQRTNCVYRKMREMIQNGEIGQFQRINWVITNWYRPDKYYEISPWRATWKGEGGGLIINQACHQIDLLQWLVGEMPIAVNGFLGFGQWHNIEADDEITAYLRYKNGASGVFITTTGEYPGCNRLEISGTKGKLTVENDKLLFAKLDTDTAKFSSTAKGAYDKPTFKEIEVETDGMNPQHAGIIKNFTNAILGKEDLKISGSEGLKAVELINGIIYSGWHDGLTVQLPVNEDKYIEKLNEKIENSKFLK